MARKFVISPTKLRVFNACEAKYRLEYIDKIGKFYHRSRAGFAFGNSLHRALDAFHNAGGVEAVPAEELTASLDQLWVAKGYSGDQQEAEYRAEGLRILQEYHAVQQAVVADAAQRAEAPPPPKVLFTEKTLRIDLSPDVALSGRVDRVDEHQDGALEIVDYKSGRETVTEEDVADSLALGVYQLLLKRKYPDRRVFATLIALRTGSQASHELSSENQENLAAECLETGEQIRNKDWENALPILSDHCSYCDFLPHCTRFWKQQARRH